MHIQNLFVHVHEAVTQPHRQISSDPDALCDGRARRQTRKRLRNDPIHSRAGFALRFGPSVNEIIVETGKAGVTNWIYPEQGVRAVEKLTINADLPASQATLNSQNNIGECSHHLVSGGFVVEPAREQPQAVKRSDRLKRIRRSLHKPIE